MTAALLSGLGSNFGQSSRCNTYPLPATGNYRCRAADAREVCRQCGEGGWRNPFHTMYESTFAVSYLHEPYFVDYVGMLSGQV